MMILLRRKILCVKFLGLCFFTLDGGCFVEKMFASSCVIEFLWFYRFLRTKFYHDLDM